MRLQVSSPDQLGLAIRAVRKATGVRQDDLAGTLGLSTRFASEVEHGKPTAQLGKVLQLLDALGIGVTLELPDEAAALLQQLQQRYETQAGHHQRRRPRRQGTAADDDDKTAR